MPKMFNKYVLKIMKEMFLNYFNTIIIQSQKIRNHNKSKK